MQKTGITLLAIIVIIICAGLVWYVMGSGSEQNGQEGVSAQTQELRDQLPNVVAVVNGEEIGKNQFLTLGEQIALQQTNEGGDISSSDMQLEISNQALNLLVNQALLVQAAEAAGTQVGDTVDQQYAQLVQSAGGVEEFEAQLQQANTTQEQIREDLRAQLLIQTHLENKLNLEGITVTEEEINQFYEQLVAQQGEGTPALEELRDQIAAQLQNQKEAQVVNQYLTQLREDADIQVNI